ncbi:MAG: hypothetical protein EBZ58_07750 [Bacteroidetes bacterium]|jgi:hypothetical protein|nr:hypothetical protein [Bacteroidota bacterium]
MTKLLEKAFSELNKLPENEQNNFAQLIIEELNWENSFASSQDTLLSMANEAITEYKAGKTKPFDEL